MYHKTLWTQKDRYHIRHLCIKHYVIMAIHKNACTRLQKYYHSIFTNSFLFLHITLHIGFSIYLFSQYLVVFFLFFFFILWLHSNSHELVNFVFWFFSPPLDGYVHVLINVFSFTMLKYIFVYFFFGRGVLFVLS